jgi:hypothetical protein
MLILHKAQIKESEQDTALAAAAKKIAELEMFVKGRRIAVTRSKSC